MRLIDADVLKEQVQDYLALAKTGDEVVDFVKEITVEKILNIIDRLPTKFKGGY